MPSAYNRPGLAVPISMKYTLLILLSVIGFAALQAQTDPIPADLPPRTAVPTDSSGFDIQASVKAYFTPEPKKAMILSLALPGAGQVYNRRWWKLPFVYGALGGMYAVIDYNQSRYRRFRTALDLKRAGMEHEFSGTQIDNEQSLRTIRNGYDKNTQMSYFGFILVYALQAMEAFVDAHLKNFDIDDDLSLRVRPTLDVVPGIQQPVMGIGLSIPLHGHSSPLRSSFPHAK